MRRIVELVVSGSADRDAGELGEWLNDERTQETEWKLKLIIEAVWLDKKLTTEEKRRVCFDNLNLDG